MRGVSTLLGSEFSKVRARCQLTVIPSNVSDTKDHLCAETCGGIRYAGSALRVLALIFRHGTEDTFGAMPIRYSDDYPSVAFDEDGIDVLQSMVKGRSWIYEGEWRMTESRKARQWHEILPNLLVGVVYGMRASDETRAFMHDLIARRIKAGLPGLHVYRAAKVDSFEIAFERMAPGGWIPATWPLAPSILPGSEEPTTQNS